MSHQSLSIRALLASYGLSPQLHCVIRKPCQAGSPGASIKALFTATEYLLRLTQASSRVSDSSKGLPSVYESEGSRSPWVSLPCSPCIPASEQPEGKHEYLG